MTDRGIGRLRPAPLAFLTAVVVITTTALLWVAGLPGYVVLALPPIAILAAAAFVAGRLPARSRRSSHSVPAGGPPATSIEEAVDMALTRREEGRLVFESVDEGIVVVSADLTIVEANPAATRLLGRGRARRGQFWRESAVLLDAKGEPLVGSADPFTRTVATGRKSEASARLGRAEGDIIPVHVTVAPAHSALAATRSYMVIIRDQSATQRQARAVAELVAEVVHDLRTPLTTLQGFAELLLGESGTPVARREWLGLIRAEALRLGQTIDELLDLVRLHMGKARVHCADHDLASLVDEVLTPFRAAQTHSFSLERDSAQARIHGDAAKVARALTNLIANAVKYSPRGSAVGLRVYRDGDQLAFEVTDSGPGVLEHERERIFEPFFRGSDWTEPHATIEGSGLGLTIVRSVAHLHGGDASVTNRPQGGAAFTMIIGQPNGCRHRAATVKG